MSALPPLERQLSVLIVDDHDVVHWGMRIMLERLGWVEKAFSARSGDEAARIAASEQIDLALIDLLVGTESGAEICERLHVVRPGLKVLLISGAGQISPRAAASCGASGFVSKDRHGADLVRAVMAVAAGGTAFESDAGDEQDAGAVPALSEREREVLAQLAAGATNQEIADHLHLSRHTVKEYASAVYRKLEVRNRMQAVRRAEQLRLIG